MKELYNTESYLLYVLCQTPHGLTLTDIDNLIRNENN